MIREGTARLSDGRALGYAEYGDPDGQPILEFHGLPGSRFYDLDHQALTRSGARLLTLERPGIGLSDPQSRRALTDGPRDVADFAEELGLDRFSVLGTWEGGPYALATGLGLSERVSGVGLMSALGPAFNYPDFDEGLPISIQFRMPLARQDREVSITVVQSLYRDARQSWIIDPDVVLQDFVRTRPEHDRAAFEAEADMWRHTLAATYSQEGGYATDLNLVIGPWQLDLSAMKVPVRAWHGSNDLSAPIGLVQKVVEATRGELVMIPGQGHYIDAKFHAEMIRWLVDPH